MLSTKCAGQLAQSSLVKPAVFQSKLCPSRIQQMTTKPRVSSLRQLKRGTLKEKIMAPAGDGGRNINYLL